jgi:hypothetical protein
MPQTTSEVTMTRLDYDKTQKGDRWMMVKAIVERSKWYCPQCKHLLSLGILLSRGDRRSNFWEDRELYNV